MAKRSLSIGFLAGLMAGSVAAVVLLSGHTAPKATAQALPPPGEQSKPATVQPSQIHSQAPALRYQISTWSTPGANRDTGGIIVPEHGAYILDTQSGKVWEVKGSGKPKSLGSVE